jgi:soluble lytic murein transglycosylase
MHAAFVASTDLRPMAQQLLQNRVPAAYSGVEAYARRHSKEDAGALAWLVDGYAHTLDNEYAKAIEPLNRAKTHAGDLEDYVDYYLGVSYFQTGRMAESGAILGAFDKNYAASLLIRDSHVMYANVLIADGRSTEAVALLEKDREPQRVDLEFALGRAYASSGNNPKAIAVFQNIYFASPLSSEAVASQSELNKLHFDFNSPSLVELRKSRAALLVKGRRYEEGANEYRVLENQVTPDQRSPIELSIAEALRRAGEARQARNLLDTLHATTPEMNAQRLFNLGEIARSQHEEDTVEKILSDIRQSAPTSPWLEEALFSAGNMYFLEWNYDKAIDCYREVEQRFPTGSHAPDAHWRVAWLNFRQNRTDVARQSFEQQIALYPNSSQVSAAIYWRARIAEEDKDPVLARAYYQKLSDRFRNYYYGALARERMTKLPASDDPVHPTLLDHVPPVDIANVAESAVPADNLRVQKAQLLANGALSDFAIRELQAAEPGKPTWLPAETAKIYTEVGRYDLAIEALKHAVPNYFALDLPNLPRSYWEALFPKGYWPDLKTSAASNGLDPYLVASLIRQESEFSPTAVSRANALGLMQLLPKTGRLVAKQEKIRGFTTGQLFVPGVNLKLGTRYFRSMVDQFGGFEYALAAYNAGDFRVKDWLGQRPYRDPQEFVESIPFTETREYVQAIVRNAYVYRQLYGTP